MRKLFLAIVLVASAIMAPKVQAQNEFITEWVTTDGSIEIPTSASFTMSGEAAPYTYNYDVEWFNKTTGVSLGSATAQTGNYTIGSLPTDTIEVRITGTFPHFYMNYNVEIMNKLIHVKQWGNMQWKSFEHAFYGCRNLKTVAATGIDLTQVKYMNGMFASARSFNGDLSAWNTSSVINMNGTFAVAISFNGDLSTWNTSSVTNMSELFVEASSFNGDISTWNTSSVTDMSYMFNDASSFNGDISAWNTSSVTNMEYMFYSANSFNGDLSSWDITNVTDMSSMFRTSNVSYCNMDAILNAWAPVLLSKTYNIGFVPAASVNSAAVRTSLGSRISLSTAEVTNPITNTVAIQTPANACLGDVVSLSANSTYTSTYKWNNVFSGNTYSFSLTQDTLVPVIAFDSLNCRSYDTIAITANTLPTVSIAADTTTICNGNEANLIASGADTYVWSTQATEEDITVAPIVTTTYTVTGTAANGCENTASVEIAVEECVGLEENAMAFTVYPNPVTDYVIVDTKNIDLSKATIALLDITGKVLMNAMLTENNTSISVANYPAGVYFIKVQAGNAIHIEKLVKR